MRVTDIGASCMSRNANHRLTQYLFKVPRTPRTILLRWLNFMNNSINVSLIAWMKFIDTLQFFFFSRYCIVWEYTCVGICIYVFKEISLYKKDSLYYINQYIWIAHQYLPLLKQSPLLIIIIRYIHLCNNSIANIQTLNARDRI